MIFKFYNVPIFKNLSDPINQTKKRYFMFVNILNFFDYDFNNWKDTNPRSQSDLNKKIYKEVKQTLHDSPETFHIKNKGILFFVKKCTFNNIDKSVEIEFDDPKIHGNIDGGHTLAIIQNFIYETIAPQILKSKGISINDYNQLTDDSEKSTYLKNILISDDFYKKFNHFSDSYVLVEVFENMSDDSEISEIVKCRNSSLQVNQKSLDNLAKKYDGMKEILKSPPKHLEGWMLDKRISVKQGENIKNEIDILELAALLEFFINDSNETPSLIYNGWKKLSEKFIDRLDSQNIDDSLKYNFNNNGLYKKLKNIFWKIIELYDSIECNFQNFASECNKSYGKKTYSEYKDGQVVGKSVFSLTELKYRVPSALVKPIMASFKHLVFFDNTNNEYMFKEDPVKIWKENIKNISNELVLTILDASENYHNNKPNSIGKDKGLYNSLSNIVQKYYKN